MKGNSLYIKEFCFPFMLDLNYLTNSLDKEIILLHSQLLSLIPEEYVFCLIIPLLNTTYFLNILICVLSNFLFQL